MNTNNREEELRQHLASQGIRHFDGDHYWDWGGEMLGENLGMQLNELREPLVEGSATPAQLRRFYDFVAQPRVAQVVHSMKADAILRSGLFIAEQLPQAGTVLDVGCSIGYLTTFYALSGPQRSVIGWDWSKSSVEAAGKQAARRAIVNVCFEQRDIGQHVAESAFDAICSSQALGTPEVGPAALENAVASLKPEGRLICVEPLPNVERGIRFLEAAASLDLGVRHHEFVMFSDLWERGAYPAFVFEKGADAIDVDLEASYARVMEALAEQSPRDVV